MTRKEQAQALAAELAKVGIYGMYGGTKGHGYWLMESKTPGDEVDAMIRQGKGFEWMMSEARAARNCSGMRTLENDGKRSGNPFFTMFSDAKAVLASRLATV